MPATFDRSCWLLAAIALVAGCQARPRAPALQDEPIYQNPQEGLRFIAPDGWKLRARGEMPSGPLQKERLLVEYRRLDSVERATLVVGMIDAPPSTELPECLAERAKKLKGWLPIGAVETFELAGRPAARSTYQLTQNEDSTLMEVVAVRRGKRLFYFTGVYVDSDLKAREQIRKAVASATW